MFRALWDWRDVGGVWCDNGARAGMAEDAGMGLRFGGNAPRRIERNVLDSYSESSVGLV